MPPKLPAKKPHQKPPKPTADNRIFVGSIPHYITDSILKNRFNQHGAVKDMFYVKDYLGSDRGFACITYASIEEAATAVALEDKSTVGEEARGGCWKTSQR